MTQLLALETSGQGCSVALVQRVPGQPPEMLQAMLNEPRQQTARLLPMIDELLADAGWSLQDIDAIAYARGPGAFTGVRVGAAVAQGLALGVDVPVLPVCSLQALAQHAHRHSGANHVAAGFDARMNEVYLGLFAAQGGVMRPLSDVVATPPEHISEVLSAAWAALPVAASLAAGSAWASYGEALSSALPALAIKPDWHPRAQDVADLAWLDWQANRGLDPALALPVYLRDNVWKKLPGRAP